MLAQLVGLVGFQAVDELMKIAVIVRCGHTSKLRHRGGTGRAWPDAETQNRTRRCAVPPGHGTSAPPGGLAGVKKRVWVGWPPRLMWKASMTLAKLTAVLAADQ